MQITSTMNKYAVLAMVFIISVASKTSAAGPVLEERSLFTISNSKNICIRTTRSASPNKCDQVFNVRNVDKNLAIILKNSEEIFPAFSKKTSDGNYFVFISRAPSKAPQSTGYCGAGFEDSLILLLYKKNKLYFRDDFLLQSCLQSIILESDDSSDILKSITIDSDSHLIKFRWMTKPNDMPHTVEILGGKFSLK
jgi:hypothetical protein